PTGRVESDRWQTQRPDRYRNRGHGFGPVRTGGVGVGRLGDEPTPRTDRGAVGVAGAAAPAGDAAERQAGAGAPGDRQRHRLEAAHRRRLARPAGAVRAVVDRRPAASAAGGWPGSGTGWARRSRPGRTPRGGGVGGARGGRDGGAGAPARGRGRGGIRERGRWGAAGVASAPGSTSARRAAARR